MAEPYDLLADEETQNNFLDTVDVAQYIGQRDWIYRVYFINVSLTPSAYWRQIFEFVAKPQKR